MGTRAAIHKYAVIIGISGFALAYSPGAASAQQFDPSKHHNCYNIQHDPGERYPDLGRYCLWAAPGFGKLIQDHMAMIEKFPHRVQNGFQREFDFPFDPDE